MFYILADNTKSVNYAAGLPAEALNGGVSCRSGCHSWFDFFNYFL